MALFMSTGEAASSLGLGASEGLKEPEVSLLMSLYDLGQVLLFSRPQHASWRVRADTWGCV